MVIFYAELSAFLCGTFSFSFDSERAVMFCCMCMHGCTVFCCIYSINVTFSLCLHMLKCPSVMSTLHVIGRPCLCFTFNLQLVLNSTSFFFSSSFVNVNL